jgi:hypothetical protein
VKVFHKIILFALLFIYSFETIGITRYMHFCGGEISSDNFFVQQKACCCDDIEESEDDCCEDVIKAVQFKENSLVNFLSLSDFLKNNSVLDLFNVVSFFNNIQINYLNFSITQLVDIPPGKSPPIIKLVCTYLI